MFDWIRTWTFFNWLAIIAFGLALVGFLNSFLSLRSHYLDWRGTQNKKAFEYRLKQLEDLVNTVGTYKKDLPRFLSMVSTFIATILLMSLEGAIAFVCAYAIRFLALASFESTATLLLVCLMFLLFATAHALKLVRMVRYVNVPDELVKRVTDFLSDGAKNGLTTEDTKFIIKLLFDHNLITVGQHEQLESLVGNS